MHDPYGGSFAPDEVTVEKMRKSMTILETLALIGDIGEVDQSMARRYLSSSFENSLQNSRLFYDYVDYKTFAVRNALALDSFDANGLEGLGLKMWNLDNIYGITDTNSADDLIVSSDDTMTILGISLNGSNNLGWVVHLDESGDLVWFETYDSSEDFSTVSFVEVSPDVYTFAAVLIVDMFDLDIWVAKVAKPMSGLTSMNQVHEAGLFFSYDLNAESALGIDTWWLNTSYFSVNIDGLITNATHLTVGTYGITASVNDTGGRELSTEFSVTVIDTMPPTWKNIPTDQLVEYGTKFLYDVGAYDPSGISKWWLNDSQFSVDTNGVIQNNTILSLGNYPLTISVNDTLGQLLSVGITVTVQDSIDPLPIDLQDFDYEMGNPGFWLNWSCEELLPIYYELQLNGSELSSGAWDGSVITLFVDSLDLGTHIYTIFFEDTSGNQGQDTLTINAMDSTNPAIDSPLDIWYIEGVGGNLIEWHPQDVLSNNYIIFHNGIRIRNGGWSDGSTISIPVDDLSEGSHNYTIIVYDVTGNYAVDTVMVNVQASTTTTTTTTPTTTTETTTPPFINQTQLQQTIKDLYNQLGGLTIGMVIVGAVSAVSIALLVIILRKPND